MFIFFSKDANTTKTLVKNIASKTDFGYCVPKTGVDASATLNGLNIDNNEIQPVYQTNIKEPNYLSPCRAVKNQAILDYEIDDDIENAFIKALNMDNNVMEDKEITAHSAASSLVGDSEIKTAFHKQNDFPFSYLIKTDAFEREAYLENVEWDIDRITDEDENFNMYEWKKHQQAKRQVTERENKIKPTSQELLNKQQNADSMRQINVQSLYHLDMPKPQKPIVSNKAAGFKSGQNGTLEISQHKFTPSLATAFVPVSTLGLSPTKELAPPSIPAKVMTPLPAVVQTSGQPSSLGATSIAKIGIVSSQRKSQTKKQKKQKMHSPLLTPPPTVVNVADKKPTITPLPTADSLLGKVNSPTVTPTPMEVVDIADFDGADSSYSTPPLRMRSPSLITPSSLRIESGDSFESFFSVSPTSRLESSPEIESHYYSDDDEDNRWASSPLQIDDSVLPPLSPDPLLITDDVWADFADF